MRTIRAVLISGILSACFLCLVGGCEGQESSHAKQGTDAINYIEGKYNRAFTPISYDLADPLSDRDEVECYTDGMDTENGEHAVIYIMNEDGETVFRDNFFSFLVRDEAERYIAGFISKEYEECKVYRQTDKFAMPDSLKEGDSLDDLYREDPEYRMGFTAYICGDDSGDDEEKAGRILDDLRKTGHTFYVQLFVVDRRIYDRIERYRTDAFMDEYVADSDSLDDILEYQYTGFVGGSVDNQ